MTNRLMLAVSLYHLFQAIIDSSILFKEFAALNYQSSPLFLLQIFLPFVPSQGRLYMKYPISDCCSVLGCLQCYRYCYRYFCDTFNHVRYKRKITSQPLSAPAVYLWESVQSK